MKVENLWLEVSHSATKYIIGGISGTLYITGQETPRITA